MVEPMTGRPDARWRRRCWSAAALVLLAPLLAMQVSQAVQWDRSDFAMLAAMLVAAGIGLEIVMRFVPSRRGRLLEGAVIFLAFLTIFADAAVGVFPG